MKLSLNERLGLEEKFKEDILKNESKMIQLLHGGFKGYEKMNDEELVTCVEKHFGVKYLSLINSKDSLRSKIKEVDSKLEPLVEQKASLDEIEKQNNMSIRKNLKDAREKFMLLLDDLKEYGYFKDYENEIEYTNGAKGFFRMLTFKDSVGPIPGIQTRSGFRDNYITQQMKLSVVLNSLGEPNFTIQLSTFLKENKSEDEKRFKNFEKFTQEVVEAYEHHKTRALQGR